MIQKHQGDTIILGCEVRLWATNALYTPTTSYTVTLADSGKASKLAAQTLTVDSTGDLSHAYDIPSDAALSKWRGYFTMDSGGTVTTEKFVFEVLEL